MKFLPERCLRVIVNGKAAGNQALRAAVEAMRREDVRLEVRVTWEGGDAVRYAADAVRMKSMWSLQPAGTAQSTRSSAES